MLEAVDFSLKDMSKDEYKTLYAETIKKLVVLQQKARSQGIGLVVLFEGWNGAGKGSRISDLMYNLDARATSVHVTENLNIEQARSFAGASQGVTGFYPLMQEFWKALGERGTMSFFDRGWYTTSMQHLLYAHFGQLRLPKDKKARHMLSVLSDVQHATIRERLDSVESFERQLVKSGYAVVKFFIHITAKEQKRRLTHLHDNPATRWRVSEDKLARIGNYEEAYVLYDDLLEGSNFSFAPWVLLNGENKRRTNATIALTLVRALESALVPQEPIPTPVSAQRVLLRNYEGEASDRAHGEETVRAESKFASPMGAYPHLDTVDHTLALDRATYKHELKGLQRRFNKLENHLYQQRVPLIMVYEGWDAAGKGGTIKRLAQALDARAYTIFPSPAPSRSELAHPHLWRYWTRLPKAGHVGFYDRSWYGRVLVERVEGFASVEEWKRAYDEINEFELDLVNWGAILLKFWVDVSQDEQLRRFYERQADPAKQWKITDEDWRNREKYPYYKSAVEDMFRLTSTHYAPWTILESDNKYYARVKALKIVVEALEARLYGAEDTKKDNRL